MVDKERNESYGRRSFVFGGIEPKDQTAGEEVANEETKNSLDSLWAAIGELRGEIDIVSTKIENLTNIVTNIENTYVTIIQGGSVELVGGSGISVSEADGVWTITVVPSDFLSIC